MTIALNVLEHLGENLYSSTPAVLAEAVANAWDANARTVDIQIDKAAQRIVITDDGDGMDLADVNLKFLTVGYHRRESDEPDAVTNRLGRHVMGRKGIGKLSLFAIARTIDVHTIRIDSGGNEIDRHAFRMRTADIRAAATADPPEDYYPEPLDASEISIGGGTQIMLTDLDSKATELTITSLRKRLARRFSILGSAQDFVVNLNGSEIGIEDRDYFAAIQYLWSIGDVGDMYEKQARNAQQTRRLPGVVDAEAGWHATGWVGTIDEQRSLEEGNDVVVLLAWGKLVQEDILKDIKAGGLYTKYLIGEIRADFLDLDEEPDIATSDRQRLKETDPRYRQIREWFRTQILPEVGNNWRDWRRQTALDDALRHPGVEEWYATVTEPDDKAAAKKLFGRIGTVMRDRDVDRAELYRHTILAFETLKVRRALSAIDELPEDADVAAFQKVFGGLDEVEAAEYHRIARGRLEVIERFRDIAPSEREKVIQAYLFDHLWLLHPSWERPTTNKQIEQAVQKEWGKIDAKLTEEEQRGRVDIRYTTAAGKHIIVELKKSSVAVNVFRIAEQMEKYRGALEKVLRTRFPDEPDPNIETIAIVGQLPDTPAPERQRVTLQAVNGRMLTYDKLIEEALDSYRDYLDADERVSRLNEILEKLEGEVEASLDATDEPETASAEEVDAT
jgi:hypothetical protein